MSLFNFVGNNFNKSGSGVAKDVPEKKPFFKFWEIFFRKFWSLMLLNVVFILLMLPLIGLSVGIFFLLKSSSFVMSNNIVLSGIIILSPLMLSGPIIAATQKITRDFSRENPCFVWADFFDCLKHNIVQPLVISIISYFAFSALSIAIPFYYYSNLGVIRYLLFGLCVFFFVMILFMQYYLYTMTVTFDLSLKQILKNSIIITTVTLVRNLLITLTLIIYVGIILLILLNTSAMNILFPILMMFYVLIGFAFFSLVVSFITFPALKKYIIDPYYNNANEVSTTEQLESEDNETIDNKSEYIYVNGRMVPRAAVEEKQIFSDDVK